MSSFKVIIKMRLIPWIITRADQWVDLNGPALALNHSVVQSVSKFGGQTCQHTARRTRHQNVSSLQSGFARCGGTNFGQAWSEGPYLRQASVPGLGRGGPEVHGTFRGPQEVLFPGCPFGRVIWSDYDLHHGEDIHARERADYQQVKGGVHSGRKQDNTGRSIWSRNTADI